MVKPNFYYYERYETLLLEAQRLSLAEIGTLQLLKWHAWQRWNPDTERFPSLPNDEKVFAKLCNRTRNWQRVRDGVMSVLAVEGDIVYYPPHRKEAENLTRHAERQAAKKTKTAKTTAKPVANRPCHCEAAEAAQQTSATKLNARSFGMNVPAPVEKLSSDRGTKHQSQNPTSWFVGFRVTAWLVFSSSMRCSSIRERLREALSANCSM